MYVLTVQRKVCAQFRIYFVLLRLSDFTYIIEGYFMTNMDEFIRCLHEITYPFWNIDSCTVKFRNGWLISSQILQ